MPRVYPAMPDRFWSKVDRSGGDLACWIWTGATARNGYGRIKLDGKNTYAHRVALTMSGIEIPKGMHVDHLCENPACVNPGHLDVVTPCENFARSRQLAA